MAFASYDFASTFGTNLETANASFSKQSGFSATGQIGQDNSSLITTSPSYCIYQHSASPASADYSVFADVTQVNSGVTGFAGVAGRLAAAASTGYAAFILNDRDEIRLYRFDSTTPTQIGSSSAISLSDGVAVNVELRMANNQISVYADGVAKCGSPVTDGTYSGAGKAGTLCVDTRVSGVSDRLRLDNWSAVDATTGLKANPIFGGGAAAGPMWGYVA